jgi:hypothetical protein
MYQFSFQMEQLNQKYCHCCLKQRPDNDMKKETFEHDGKRINFLDAYFDVNNISIEYCNKIPISVFEICATCTVVLESAYIFRRMCEIAIKVLHRKYETQEQAATASLTEVQQNGEVIEEARGEDRKMPTIISTQNEISANDHNIIIETQRRYLCDICGKSYSQKLSIRAHIQAIHLGMLISCKKCLKIYKDPNALYRHNQQDHKKIICLICKKTFTRSHYLKMHNESVHKKIRFQCEKCLRKYSTLQSLRKHFNTYHLKIRLTCKYCPKTFRQSSSLKYHINNKHLNSQISNYLYM